MLLSFAKLLGFFLGLVNALMKAALADMDSESPSAPPISIPVPFVLANLLTYEEEEEYIVFWDRLLLDDADDDVISNSVSNSDKVLSTHPFCNLTNA